MSYLIRPSSIGTVSWAWADNVFSNEELDRLNDLALCSKSSGEIGQDNQIRQDTSVRRVKVSWLECNDQFLWVYERLEKVVSELNAQHFQFDITCFGELFQLATYSEKDHGGYDWHMDTGSFGLSRKLSVVVQLTDPSKYDGGNLEMRLGPHEPTVVPKQKGMVCVFPSFTVHRVTPVTKGNRQSLVTWVTGPKFK